MAFIKLFKKKLRYDYDKIFRDLIFRLQTLERQNDNLVDLLKGIISYVGSQSGSIFVVRADKQILALKSYVGDEPLIVSLSTDHEFVDYLKNNKSVLFKDEILNKNEYLMIRSPGIHFFTQTNSVIAIALKVQDEWVGMLTVGKGRRKDAFNEEDRRFLEIMGYWLAYHISNNLLYSRVKNQNIKLNEMTEVKNELMSNVTHELRTPLNGILGLTEIILDGSDGPLTQDQKIHLEMIKNSGESILSIVNNILSLIKVEAGKRELSVGKIVLKNLVDEVASLYEGVFKSKNNQFASILQNDQIIYGNEGQIRTVLMNLIGNAAKFTDAGQIEIRAQKSGEMLKVIVKDSGIGIPENAKPKIFDEFIQADASLTRAHGGAGLGLAVAKKIIEIHGGRIGVDS
ncbi:MAG: Sensory box sensor histidine kinase/response regulator, partial [uncultured bacterium]